MLAEQDEYKVELDVFEGPLDLLLYLIKKEEVDIYNIPIERITSRYMEYLNLMRMLDLGIAGEFIVMAATLMLIKSRMLLPADERPEEEAEEEDPRWDLVRQLVAYKKFKDAAAWLQDRALLQENAFGRGGEPPAPGADAGGIVIEDISLFDLITAFNDVLKRVKPESLGEVMADRFTVGDKIDFILGSVRGGCDVRFHDLFEGMAARAEIICTFLAVLELIRLRQIRVLQREPFGEIVITGIEEGDTHGERGDGP